MRDRKPANDHVQTALEASCAVLIAMESIRASISDSDSCVESVQALATDAIVELRRAIREIYLAREQQPRLLPDGFVLGADPEPSQMGEH